MAANFVKFLDCFKGAFSISLLVILSACGSDSGYYLVYPEAETTQAHARSNVVDWLITQMED